MTMPAQKPGRSKQDYATPWDVVHAVEKWLGESFVWDLAADEHNKKAPGFYSIADNSLVQPWHKYKGLLWLNPPFANLAEWALKCADESRDGARIVMLTPASVSTEWYYNHCHGVCRTVFLKPRITFVGCDDPYPKDLMLTLWGLGPSGYEIFDWRNA